MAQESNFKTFELELKKWNKLVAHVRCSCINGCVEIKELFVQKKFKEKGIEQYLMSKVDEFAEENSANQIIKYLTIEPWSDSKTDLDKERTFYEANGYSQSHLVRNVIPCLVKRVG